MRSNSRADLGLVATLWSMLRTPVPRGHRGWLKLGWPLLLLFMLQVATGILLSFYYQPSPGEAGESVRRIMRDVDWGWLVRGVHYWSAQGMVAFTLLQLGRALIAGSWRGAASGSWLIGLLLIPLVVLLAFSGELLRWDAPACAMLARALDASAHLPAVGPGLALLFRGGEEISATTLSRIHSAHTQFLPWLVFVLVIVNLTLLVRRRRARQDG
ncbi:MAG: cytochrome b N-terminal domain-containing protein [Planctomycetota bacterium]